MLCIQKEKKKTMNDPFCCLTHFSRTGYQNKSSNSIRILSKIITPYDLRSNCYLKIEIFLGLSQSYSFFVDELAFSFSHY